MIAIAAAHSARRALLIVAAIAALAACERQPAPPTPATKTPAVAITAESAPALYELGQCYSTLSMDQWMQFIHVYPIRAALELDEEAGPEAKTQLVELLQSNQELIQRVIALSRRPLETFPPFPTLDEISADAHLGHPRTWATALTRRLLSTDASREWEAGNIDAAVARLAAMVRLGHELITRGDGVDAIIGGAVAGQASSKLAEMVEKAGAGGPPISGVTAITPATAEDLRAALARFDPQDPAGLIPGWKAAALESAKACRETYAVKGGPARLADFFRDSGIFEAAAQSADAPVDGLATLPTKEAADQAGRLSIKQISDAIADAEKLIEPIAARIAANDADGLRALMNQVRDDPTQIARVILGGATLHLNAVRSARESFARGLAAADRLPKP